MKHINLYKGTAEAPSDGPYPNNLRRAQTEAVHERLITLEDEEQGPFTVELDDDL